MAKELKVGDVVKLKSGGPSMTVRSLGDAREACTDWFQKESDGGWSTALSATFQVDELVEP